MITATCDLEKVLTVPYSQAGQLYYLRKLNVFNFTVFEHASKKGFAFVWNECEGKRGSAEIGTCLVKYISTIGPKVVHLIIFSDSCGGQNRNQFTAHAVIHGLKQNKNELEIVDQKFLVRGHTDMEVDSMHGVIEKSYQVSTVMVPDDLHNVIRVARRNNPYEIIPMEHSDFINFKSSNRKFGNVRWTDVRQIRYLKEEPNYIYVKYSFDSRFESICLRKPTRKSKANSSFQLAYNSRLPISCKKKKDLLKGCKEGIIPAEYHNFYQNLPSSEEVVDRLNEPDITESDGEDC